VDVRVVAFDLQQNVSKVRSFEYLLDAFGQVFELRIILRGSLAGQKSPDDVVDGSVEASVHWKGLAAALGQLLHHGLDLLVYDRVHGASLAQAQAAQGLQGELPLLPPGETSSMARINDQNAHHVLMLLLQNKPGMQPLESSPLT